MYACVNLNIDSLYRFIKKWFIKQNLLKKKYSEWETDTCFQSSADLCCNNSSIYNICNGECR
jgi:hypothetical protein